MVNLKEGNWGLQIPLITRETSFQRMTNICNARLVSSPSFSISKLVLRGLIALASLGGNSSLQIATSGWSRGTMLVPLDFRLFSRGPGASVRL